MNEPKIAFDSPHDSLGVGLQLRQDLGEGIGTCEEVYSTSTRSTQARHLRINFPD